MDKNKPHQPPGFSESQDEFDASVHDNWPNSFRTREELDAMLDAGLKSGISPRTIPEIVEQTLRDLKNE